MVQRSKRSMSPHQAAEMQRQLRDFHRHVRTWCSEVPIGDTIYVALENLNHGIVLADRQFTATIDGAPYRRPPGENGLD